MKKLFSFVLLTLASAAPAMAQWNTDATPATVYSTADRNSDYHACSVKAARTADKKTWIAWKTWGNKLYGETKVTAVRTFLQLLDRDGVPQFEEPIMVNDHITLNNDGVVDVADIATVISIMAGK